MGDSIRLSWPQERTLRDLAAGGDGMRGVHGRSMHGGMYKVWGSLVQRGLVAYSVQTSYQITEAGRQVLAETRP